MAKQSSGSTFGGILLVAGTAIGGGMLALPVLTAAGGFWPAVVLYTLCWLFMASTALLLVEVFLWSPKETNIVSMAKMTLGKPGKIVAWILYLFLFYSLTVAYVSGGGNLVKDVVTQGLRIDHFYPGWGPLIFVLIFAPFVIAGAKTVDRVNVCLMGGLIISFIVFVTLGVGRIRLDLLSRVNWPVAFVALPVVFTSFGFQGMIPTLTNYLNRDYQRMRKVVWLGSAIPLVAYILWEALILGVVPPEGLADAFVCGQSAVYPLKNALDLPKLYVIGEFFAFFALVTSFLGVTLGLLDFLADGLKIKKTTQGRWLLGGIIFFPPLLFALVYPCLFLQALHYAGGFGCALLLGLLPILMVWRGRYILKFKGPRPLPGGPFLLTFLTLFIVFELTIMVIRFGQ